MGTADDVNEDQGVEGDEGRGSGGVDPTGGGDAGDQVGRCQDGGSRYGLEDVDGGVDRQPGERIDRQGEERAVGAGGVGPGDVGEGGVGRDARRGVNVGVEAVQPA